VPSLVIKACCCMAIFALDRTESPCEDSDCHTQPVTSTLSGLLSPDLLISRLCRSRGEGIGTGPELPRQSIGRKNNQKAEKMKKVRFNSASKT
jgi:hypothetical protein